MEEKSNPNQASAKTPHQTLVQPIAVPKQISTAPNTNVCKKCNNPINDLFYFCPNCGKKIKEPPFKFSISKTSGLILFSLLFPPFGLIPGVKYLFKKDNTARLMGVILIIISIVSTAIITIYLINATNNMLKIYSDIYSMQGSTPPNQELTPQNVLDQINALTK